MADPLDFGKPFSFQFRFDGFADSCENDSDDGHGTIKEGSFFLLSDYQILTKNYSPVNWLDDF
jgi:hypothetical protein